MRRDFLGFCLALYDLFGVEFSPSPRCRHRYEYGSAEADRRVKELGYCRVHMPSIPRTGSTWFRAMFETATSQPSFSMWPGETHGRENHRPPFIIFDVGVAAPAGALFQSSSSTRVNKAGAQNAPQAKHRCAGECEGQAGETVHPVVLLSIVRKQNCEVIQQMAQDLLCFVSVTM